MAEMRNEQFKLPDGTLVGTGNNVDPDGPELMPSRFPDELMLEDKEIERLMKSKSLKKQRDKRRKRMMSQGRVGSCNLYMAIAMKYQIDENNGLTHRALAPEYAYMNINGGQDRGSGLRRGMEWMVAKGCAGFGLVPYESYNRRQVRDIAKADADAHRAKVHEPYILPDNFSDYCRAFASAVARDFPIGIAWHVGNQSMRLRAGSNGWNYIQPGRGPGNHATLIHDGIWVGGRELVHGDLQNSWGPSVNIKYGRPSRNGWGDGGFGLSTMEMLFATRRYHEHYVMTSSKADPLTDKTI